MHKNTSPCKKAMVRISYCQKYVQYRPQFYEPQWTFIILCILKIAGSLDFHTMTSISTMSWNMWLGDMAHICVVYISLHLWTVWRLTMVDLGVDNELPAEHMPTIRWLSASIAWMRASSEPVRGCRGFTMLLRLNAHINKTGYVWHKPHYSILSVHASTCRHYQLACHWLLVYFTMLLTVE